MNRLVATLFLGLGMSGAQAKEFTRAELIGITDRCFEPLARKVYTDVFRTAQVPEGVSETELTLDVYERKLFVHPQIEYKYVRNEAECRLGVGHGDPLSRRSSDVAYMGASSQGGDLCKEVLGASFVNLRLMVSIKENGRDNVMVTRTLPYLQYDHESERKTYNHLGVEIEGAERISGVSVSQPKNLGDEGTLYNYGSVKSDVVISILTYKSCLESELKR